MYCTVFADLNMANDLQSGLTADRRGHDNLSVMSAHLVLSGIQLQWRDRFPPVPLRRDPGLIASTQTETQTSFFRAQAFGRREIKSFPLMVFLNKKKLFTPMGQRNNTPADLR